MDKQTDPGHPIGPEIDDSQNPTYTAPDEWSGAGQAGDAGQSGGAGQPGGAGQGQDDVPPRQTGAGREMLAQLQSMIDTLAVQAAPVMREVAAKAAELAAVAGEKAGPLAQKAADKTGVYGQRVAARSKEMAADLRRPQAGAEDQAAPEDQAAEAEKEPDDSARE
jgi:ElaB/YqjD/DUF883 family membrane-anchored ribosome-binding protein